MSPPLGIAGALARRFLVSEITPLLALVGLLMGVFAVAVTPREEEPQIDVTFANVFIPYPGASAQAVESLVTSAAEQILSQIEGVEHIYSVSRPGQAMLTVQFEVGEQRTEAIVRLYNAVYQNQDWLPTNLGVGPTLVKPGSIDDVPIVAGTLWTDDPAFGADDLARVAHSVQTELQRVPGTRDIYTLGAPDRVVHVQLDPVKLAGHSIAMTDLRAALTAGNAAVDAGSIVRDNQAIQVQAGTFFSTPEEIADLVVGMNAGAPVFLRDVAQVSLEPDQPAQLVRFAAGGDTPGAGVRHPAVTLAVAKKPGENAVDVSAAVIRRFEQLRGQMIPDGVQSAVTRDYGQTASDKAQTLIKKLVFATAAVVVLVWLALGWREAFIVGAAVVVTLTVTLFASWAWGFTLNRVSLFALIFSIGILVDDAIVVVENIHRHMHLGGQPLTEAIPLAVDEVGGPTILATFTVIAALLPMAFVSGLMGPYMSPIPINASMGMLISLLVAFVFTPWLFLKVFRRHAAHLANADGQGSGEQDDRLYRGLHAGFQRHLAPFLNGRRGRARRVGLLLTVLVLIAGALGLAGARLVVLKMLPFDNKSEFQVVVDMPEGTPVEQTDRVLDALTVHLVGVPEVTHVQTYAGTSAPINFNGLVRQYGLRREAHQGDIQVNLTDKHARTRQSHDIASAVRAPLQAIARPYGANVKIVEVPPGPPVRSPLVAEVYGPDAAGREALAQRLVEVFTATDEVVDVDTTLEAPQPKLIVAVDRQRAARLGVNQHTIAAAVSTALRGEDIAYLHDAYARTPIPVRLEFTEGGKAEAGALTSLRVRADNGRLVPLGEVTTVRQTVREAAIHHKDLLPVTYVTADVSGPIDSPLYAMGAIAATLSGQPPADRPLDQHWIAQPENPYRWSLKWDGEWQITYETFRDMGIAYAVGLVLIYLLVVAQFRSYAVPLIIMAPIPLTIIGILPGHALLDTPFTATSMIGMIALAGIIVRNSILLVDFIRHQVEREGLDLQEAVIRAGAVRARPIALTALAAMLGALFILDDPIFSGLAVSLIFGILVSTLLTLVVIPIVYYAYTYKAASMAS